LAVAICSSGGLVSSPSFGCLGQLSLDFGDGMLAVKLKHYRVESTLRLPGKLERERGLPRSWFTVEQCFVLLLHKCGVKHFNGLGAAYEIVRWIREKDAMALLSPQRGACREAA
jgi:hypothetical protein